MTTVPWRLTLTCRTEYCPNKGNTRDVNVPRPAEGFAEMPNYRCAGCGCEPHQEEAR